MAAVTPVPIAIAILVATLLFGAATWWLIQESRRPVAFPDHVAMQPHVSHTRMAAICVVFTLWSLWATTRPVSGWR